MRGAIAEERVVWRPVGSDLMLMGWRRRVGLESSPGELSSKSCPPLVFGERMRVKSRFLVLGTAMPRCRLKTVADVKL